jgi:two-component sensor histidine kinase
MLCGKRGAASSERRVNELLKKEFDHLLLNDLQMTISLLSLQSRESTNPEAASQLAIAANRVAMIGRIHHRLTTTIGESSRRTHRIAEGAAKDGIISTASLIVGVSQWQPIRRNRLAVRKII